MTEPITSILVADDDEMIGPLIGDILGCLGHTVCAIVTTEDAAVVAAVRHRPNLIVMDSRLRPGDGIEAMDRIVALIGPVPHIFISGDLYDVCKRVPEAITLKKPFRIEQIEEAIHCAMETVDTPQIRVTPAVAASVSSTA
ncbi:MAG: response regulator [Acidiphilium sp.]|nr:response regulator [Acidiphilium sp.]